MNILLINIPIGDYSIDNTKQYDTIIPIGIGYLASILQKNNYTVKILDAEYQKLSIKEIINYIDKVNPNIVGINVPSPNYTIIEKIINKISKKYFVLIGGTQVTLEPQRIFKLMKPNAMIVGEAEEAILYLVNNFNNLNSPNPIKGLYLKEYTKNEFKKTDFIENLDNLPFLNRTLFKNDPYLNKYKKKEASIITSRGCPCNCIFCSVSKLSGNRIRTRSMQNVIEEIIELKRLYNIESIHFVDDNFIFNIKRIKEFNNLLKENNLKIKWRALTRPEILTEELIKLISKSGCYHLAIGIENFDEKIQAMIPKKINFENIKKKIKLCKKYNITTKGFFTLGYPNETLKQITNTIKLSRELELDDINYNILRAFPGTRLIDFIPQTNKEILFKYHQFTNLDNEHNLNIDYKNKLKVLKNKKININKYLKYHFSNITPLNGMKLDEMDLVIRKAYIDFYFNKIRNERGKRG